MTEEKASWPRYSRREFIAASGKGIVGAAVASLLSAQATGCSSKAAAADADLWEKVRLDDLTLNDSYIYVNNSTFSETVYETLRDRYAIHCRHATEGFRVDGSGTVNGAVRLSPHYYVSHDELSRITVALHEIAGIQ